ncbi:hypothetical protein O0L34_g7896 [Tuta absoluta]|nr:hypothetical protein O0L34_g7896 [Tuta absoluta]
MYPVQFELVHLRGFLYVASYVHYFKPGSLKLHTKINDIQKYEEFFNESVPEFTRRWLPQGEAPFPGYCRAPSSSKCLDVLCNCKKLREIWKTFKYSKMYSSAKTTTTKPTKTTEQKKFGNGKLKRNSNKKKPK